MIINTFRDKYLFLSNFSQARIKYNGLEFKNSEAAFQAQKVLDDDKRIPFTKLAPKEAKRLGRQVELRPDWEDVKDGIMEEVVRAKFSQNGNLQDSKCNQKVTDCNQTKDEKPLKFKGLIGGA